MCWAQQNSALAGARWKSVPTNALVCCRQSTIVTEGNEGHTSLEVPYMSLCPLLGSAVAGGAAWGGRWIQVLGNESRALLVPIDSK